MHDTYCYHHKNYHMNKHGFFQDIKNWKVKHKTNNCAILYFKHNQEFYDIFPFLFTIEITLRLIKFKLSYQVKIINNDLKKIYFSFGFHPAFKLNNFKQSYIKTNLKSFLFEVVANNKIVQFSKQKYKKINLKNLNFESGQTYLIKNKIKKITFINQDYKLKLSWITCQYFLIWTKSKKDHFLCLEPWSGFLDNKQCENLNIDQKPGIITLEPNRIKNFSLTLKWYDYTIQ